MAHLDTVKEIYAAFGSGDIPTIIGHLAAGVEWEYGLNSTDVPWLQPRRGADEVGEFFRALLALDVQKFEPKGLFEAGSTVVALVDLTATVRATGRTIVEEDEVHIWHFDDAGRVSRFRHRLDTHQHFVAFHGQ